MKHKTKSGGFTLTELMIVVVLISIFAAMAAPSMYNMMISEQTKAAAHSVVSLLNATHEEAIRRNQVMVVYPVTVRSDGKPGQLAKTAKWNDSDKSTGLASFPRTRDHRGTITYGSATHTYGFNPKAVSVENVQTDYAAAQQTKNNGGYIFLPNGSMKVKTGNYEKSGLGDQGKVGKIIIWAKAYEGSAHPDKACRVIIVSPNGSSSMCKPKEMKAHGTPKEQLCSCATS